MSTESDLVKLEDYEIIRFINTMINIYDPIELLDILTNNSIYVNLNKKLETFE